METVEIVRTTKRGNVVRFIVDACYWEQKGKYHSWTCDGCGYLMAKTQKKIIKLQRDVYKFFNPTEDIGLLKVDHINHDIADNRLSNLRVCTHQQNLFNRVPNKNARSKYKGVGWHKHSNRWMAKIGLNGRHIHIGYFDNEYEAALAYNEKAAQLYGEFANPNVL
jgi:hypothetical protein